MNFTRTREEGTAVAWKKPKKQPVLKETESIILKERLSLTRLNYQSIMPTIMKYIVVGFHLLLLFELSFSVSGFWTTVIHNNDILKASSTDNELSKKTNDVLRAHTFTLPKTPSISPVLNKNDRPGHYRSSSRKSNHTAYDIIKQLGASVVSITVLFFVFFGGGCHFMFSLL